MNEQARRPIDAAVATGFAHFRRGLAVAEHSPLPSGVVVYRRRRPYENTPMDELPHLVLDDKRKVLVNASTPTGERIIGVGQDSVLFFPVLDERTTLVVPGLSGNSGFALRLRGGYAEPDQLVLASIPGNHQAVVLGEIIGIIEQQRRFSIDTLAISAWDEEMPALQERIQDIEARVLIDARKYSEVGGIAVTSSGVIMLRKTPDQEFYGVLQSAAW